MSNHPREEVTLKDIFLLAREYLRYFLSKWYVFLVAGLIGGAWFAYGATTTPGTYRAELRFSLNEDSGGGGGLGSVLGQFGLGGGKAGPNYPKISELALSSEVLNVVLFDTVPVSGDSILLANWLIDLYDYHTLWEESETMQGFTFSHAEINSFNRTENKGMKSLQSLLRGSPSRGVEGLCTIDYNLESGIIRMRVKTTSEDLSLHLAEKWYKALSELYVRQSIAPQIKTLTVIETKVDSIRGVLNRLQARYAVVQDRRPGIVLNRNLTEVERLQRELGLNQIIYGEAVKNQEQARFLLANQTPAFGVIEYPVEPISIDEPSWMIGLVKGGLIGGILAGILLFCIKLYQDTINENETY